MGAEARRGPGIWRIGAGNDCVDERSNRNARGSLPSPWFTSLAGSRSWQQVQDAFANVVGIPLQILDSAGED